MTAQLRATFNEFLALKLLPSTAGYAHMTAQLRAKFNEFLAFKASPEYSGVRAHDGSTPGHI
jgi:hypothetical protein